MEMGRKNNGSPSFEYFGKPQDNRRVIEFGIQVNEIFSYNVFFFYPGPVLKDMVPETDRKIFLQKNNPERDLIKRGKTCCIYNRTFHRFFPLSGCSLYDPDKMLQGPYFEQDKNDSFDVF